MKPIRIQKLLSRAGIASRREAERMMRAGRVQVNGEIVTELGTKVDPARDQVEVDGERVRVPELRWIAFHKPPGALTTRRDPGGRETIYDILPEGLEGLTYVGRLDLDTEGLLLLTNDGDLAHLLLHPSSEVPREYEAEVEGHPTPDAVERLEAGVLLDDGPARAERVRVLRADREVADVRLLLREGRKREVRRLLDAVGHPVRRLRRIAFGPVRLGELPVGRWRELSEEEVAELRAAVMRG